MKYKYAIEWKDTSTNEIGYCEMMYYENELHIAKAVAKLMDERSDEYKHRVIPLNIDILEKIKKL